MKPRDYVYVRLDPKVGSTRQSRETSDQVTIRTHVKAARFGGFTVHSRFAVTERIGASVSASGRPKLTHLINQLKPGDALVVYALDGFGRDASDVLKTIRRIHEMKAEAFCMSLDREHLFLDEDFMKVMEAVSTLERLADTERKQARAKGIGVAGGRIGRPPSLDDATQAAVCVALDAGETVAEVARRYKTSRQTILRVRDSKAQS